MKFLPIKTRKFLPPKDNLFKLLDDHLPALKDKDLLLITSKLVSIHQGRCVPITKTTTLKDKIALIKTEADAYLAQNPHSLALKDLTLTPYAGIDRGNANHHYILWPKHIQLQAKIFWQYLKQKHHLTHLGIIFVDSFCLPLRWGHMGISIGFYGFHPNKPYAGQKDIFGDKIIQANSNLVDGLSALGAVLMGEGNEQTPLLLVRGFTKIKFTSKDALPELKAPPSDDFYAPLLKVFKKRHSVA